MKDLIFETMLAEASFRVAEKTITGIDLEEAIHEVAEEMELDRSEVKELTTRTKKKPSTKKPNFPVAEDDDSENVDMDALMGDMEDTEVESEDVPENTIVFAPEDVETATGVLMYKGIPWLTRTATSLTFASSDDVKEAHEALKRRWDFIGANPRTVATIAFDNLEDYAAVLAFISTKRMTVLLDHESPELDQDLDIELAEAEVSHKQAKKDAKEQGLPAPEMAAHAMSYSAVRKDAAIDAGSLNPIVEPSSRSVKVAKRWK